MKKFVLMSVLVISGFMVKTADAQVRVAVNINIGSQPEWGPSGYDYAEYYYLPDIDIYYHVASHKYTYFNGQKWITVTNLPNKYRHYNLYNGYKVVVNQHNPWLNNRQHVVSYASYKGYKNQVNIRDYRKEERKVTNQRAKRNNNSSDKNGNDRNRMMANNSRSHR